MKIFLTSILVGIVAGFGAGLFFDEPFQPDFFILIALFTAILSLLRELQKLKKLEEHHRKQRDHLASDEGKEDIPV